MHPERDSTVFMRLATINPKYHGDTQSTTNLGMNLSGLTKQNNAVDTKSEKTATRKLLLVLSAGKHAPWAYKVPLVQNATGAKCNWYKAQL